MQPRLPSLPSYVRNAPLQPSFPGGIPPAPPSKDPDSETLYASWNGATIPNALAGAWAQVGLVGQTTRPWRAIDVYLNAIIFNANATTGVASIFVYGITKGARALVATGRVNVGSLQTIAGVTNENAAPQWVASARCVCDSFEVVAKWEQSGAAASPQGTLSVTAVASNQEAPPSSLLGGQMPVRATLGAIALAAVQYELVSFEAINGTATPRYIHLHDYANPGVAPYAGQIPLRAWPLYAAIGSGIAVDVGYRARSFLSLVVSSVLATTTVASDCWLSAMVR